MALSLNHFANAEKYGAAPKKLPMALMLNREKTNAGMFIKQEDLDMAGWDATKAKGVGKAYDHFFAGAEVGTPGLLLKNPRMVVFFQSPRFIEDKTTKNIVGNFETPEGAQMYGMDGNEDGENRQFTLRTLYGFFLLNDNNELVHQTPFTLSIKGAAAADLGDKLSTYYASVDATYAAAQGLDVLAMNDEFHAVTIFQPTLGWEYKGKEKKSEVCVVKDFKTPDATNIDKFLALEAGEKLISLHKAANLPGEANLAYRFLKQVSTELAHTGKYQLQAGVPLVRQIEQVQDTAQSMLSNGNVNALPAI